MCCDVLLFCVCRCGVLCTSCAVFVFAMCLALFGLASCLQRSLWKPSAKKCSLSSFGQASVLPRCKDIQKTQRIPHRQSVCLPRELSSRMGENLTKILRPLMSGVKRTSLTSPFLGWYVLGGTEVLQSGCPVALLIALSFARKSACEKISLLLSHL